MPRSQAARRAGKTRLGAVEQLRRAGAVYEARPVDVFTGPVMSVQALEGWWLGRVYLAASAAVALRVLKD